jgi:hypothetical protein
MTIDSGRRGTLHNVAIWSAALIITFIAFYALDHAVMSMQGLPLSWDLSPQQ